MAQAYPKLEHFWSLAACFIPSAALAAAPLAVTPIKIGNITHSSRVAGFTLKNKIKSLNVWRQRMCMADHCGASTWMGKVYPMQCLHLKVTLSQQLITGNTTLPPCLDDGQVGQGHCREHNWTNEQCLYAQATTPLPSFIPQGMNTSLSPLKG